MKDKDFKETNETWTIEALADSLEYEIIDQTAKFDNVETVDDSEYNTVNLRVFDDIDFNKGAFK